MHRVLKLKKDAIIGKGMSFPKGTEIEVLNDVVYMQGLPVATTMQSLLLNWINNNPDLFINDKRN